MPSSFFLNAISGANKEVAYLEKLTSRLAGKKRVSKPLHSHVGDLQRFFFSNSAGGLQVVSFRRFAEMNHENIIMGKL